MQLCEHKNATAIVVVQDIDARAPRKAESELEWHHDTICIAALHFYYYSGCHGTSARRPAPRNHAVGCYTQWCHSLPLLSRQRSVDIFHRGNATFDGANSLFST